MSTLTKTFVALLVVLSLLLTAATVTFVNKQDSYAAVLQQTNEQLTANQSRLQEEREAALAQSQQKDAAIAQANSQLDALRGNLTAMERQLADKDAQIARLNGQLASATAEGSRLTSAVAASEQTKATLTQQLAELRQAADRQQTQLSDLNTAYNDVYNKLQVTEAERRNVVEQLQAAQEQGQQQAAALRDAGIDPSRLGSAGVAAGAPPINGVIRDTRTIAGVPYATISVGGDDAVKSGMEFKILDRDSGRFLGVLTVVAVEPDEAIGRLAGPDVNAIRSGNEVRTQL